MKRPVAHQINDVARGWFNVRIPREWARNEQFSDYGIDYAVELAKAEEVSGTTFLVQLKGKEEATLKRDNTFAVSLERKNARYISEKARQPVFVVLIDVEAGDAYWLFVQEFLDNLAKVKDWRAKPKVVVHIPKANVLSNGAQLEAAVVAAYEYMAPRLVRFREQSLKKLDPRFEVRVIQTSSREEVHVRPLEPVRFTLFVPHDTTIRSKVERLLEEGLPTEFLPGEVRLEGSLLLEEIFKKGVIIEPGHSVEGAIILSALGADGQRLTEPLTLPAKITAGTKVATFDAKLNGTPIEVATATTFYSERSNVSILFDIKKWHDCDLRILPHFDRIHRFFERAEEFAALEMHLEVDGNQLVRGTSADGDFEYFKKVALYLEVVRKARFLAGRYNLTCDKFRKLTANECDDIEELYDLLAKGEHRRRASIAKVCEAKFAKEEWDKHQHLVSQDVGVINRLKAEFPVKVTCTMLGQSVDLENVVREFNFLNATAIGTAADGSIRAALHTSELSEYILRTAGTPP